MSGLLMVHSKKYPCTSVSDMCNLGLLNVEKSLPFIQADRGKATLDWSRPSWIGTATAARSIPDDPNIGPANGTNKKSAAGSVHVSDASNS